MNDPNKLINWAEVSRLLAGDRSAITRKRIPKIHEQRIKELLSLVDNWSENN